MKEDASNIPLSPHAVSCGRYLRVSREIRTVIVLKLYHVHIARFLEIHHAAFRVTMSSLGISEKIETAPDASDNKQNLGTTSSVYDVDTHGSEGLHFVTRGKVVSDDDGSDQAIIGYDAGQMRARALLSYKEEKKLFRRIDWHLMPLMSLIYLLKNLDASNVSHPRLSFQILLMLEGRKCAYHG